MTNTPATASSVKPMLRGLHHATIKKNLVVSLGLTVAVTVAYHYLINNPRKEAYADFYKTYDCQKSFERMKANGRFQSC